MYDDRTKVRERGNDGIMSNNENAWDIYSIKFNLLSDKMMDAGINLKLLTDLLESYENLPEQYKSIVE